MKSLIQMSKKELADIKMIVFDVDGVLVPRGTKIKQDGNMTTLETKVIGSEEIELIRKLKKRKFLINISSGRALYMLQEMFREILPSVSITYENGSATWYEGKIYQHVNSFKFLNKIFQELKQAIHKNSRIKGFEPKEFIMTLHCKKRVAEIEKLVKKHKNLTTVWNKEAYDIMLKRNQSKAIGVRDVMKLFKLKKKNIMAIGDNLNDREMLRESGLPISADKTKVKGKFYVPQNGEFLPANILMKKILSL